MTKSVRVSQGGLVPLTGTVEEELKDAAGVIGHHIKRGLRSHPVTSIIHYLWFEIKTKKQNNRQRFLHQLQVSLLLPFIYNRHPVIKSFK